MATSIWYESSGPTAKCITLRARGTKSVWYESCDGQVDHVEGDAGKDEERWNAIWSIQTAHYYAGEMDVERIVRIDYPDGSEESMCGSCFANKGRYLPSKIARDAGDASILRRLDRAQRETDREIPWLERLIHRSRRSLIRRECAISSWTTAYSHPSFTAADVDNRLQELLALIQARGHALPLMH